jgi:hypothetical protein
VKIKNQLKIKVFELVEKLKYKGRFSKYVRLDDTGENASIERAFKGKCLCIKFEFSGPTTPQSNGKVERKFQTLYGRVRSMLNDAGIKDKMRSGICIECASMATFYANNLVNRESRKLPHESMFKKLSKFKIFSEMVVVTTKKKIQGKLSDRSTVCMFVGYPQNHSDNI